MITVAVRRVDLSKREAGSLLEHIPPEQFHILPNTAGCYSLEDAVTTAHLARELLDTKLVKLEVIGDERTLFPDSAATIEAARILVEDGFTVLPYVIDDPVACQRLEDCGCAAVMPRGANSRARDFVKLKLAPWLALCQCRPFCFHCFQAILSKIT